MSDSLQPVPGAVVGDLRIYPIKSLDPVVLRAARLLPGGALQHDRRWLLRDAAGKWINGKRAPELHRLRARYQLPDGPGEALVFLRHEGSDQERCFSLNEDRAPLARWFSAALNQPVDVAENAATGFPDDSNAPGPTVVAEASLTAVASWFPTWNLAETRLRFRANVEIRGVPPFWDDRLFGPAATVVPFRLGEAGLLGVNPCQRCAVPPRDPHTGRVELFFQKRFSLMRKQTLPPWAERSRFDHFYRLAVNTRPSDGLGALVQVGDPVFLGPPIPVTEPAAGGSG